MSKKEYSKEELEVLGVSLQKGSEEAFSELYDHFVENIYRFIFFKVNSDDAEDLTEIVFIKVWEHKEKFDCKKSAIGSWIYTIARNTVIDHYRVFKQSEELHDGIEDEEVLNPKLFAEESLRFERLNEGIHKLSENYKDVVLLRFIEDMEYSEIAKVLEKSEGSIRIMQFRALKELKKILQEMNFDE